MTEPLTLARADGVATLTLTRPEARNALNTALLAALAEAFDALAADDTVRCVVVRGADGQFAAGADIGEIADKTSADGRDDPRKAHWAAIGRFPKPWIAAVEGACLGGGLELATLADLMVVDPKAKLGQPETSLGLVPGAGGGIRLLALAGRARAMRLVLTGEIVSGETAYAWGIASHLAAPGDALGEADRLAHALAGRAPRALRAARQTLRDAARGPYEAALAAERAAFEALLDTADKREGITAFREKRTPRFTGE